MIEVRTATGDDIEAMAALQATGWRQAFEGIVRPELDPSAGTLAVRMRERFADPSRRRIVAERGGELCGFCIFGPSRDEGAKPEVAEIYVLFVAPAAWRRGVGRALVDAALARLHDFAEVRLWSAPDSARATAFYEALGFVRDGAEQLRADFGNVREVRYRLALPRRP